MDQEHALSKYPARITSCRANRTQLKIHRVCVAGPLGGGSAPTSPLSSGEDFKRKIVRKVKENRPKRHSAAEDKNGEKWTYWLPTGRLQPACHERI